MDKEPRVKQPIVDAFILDRWVTYTRYWDGYWVADKWESDRQQYFQMKCELLSHFNPANLRYE